MLWQFSKLWTCIFTSDRLAVLKYERQITNHKKACVYISSFWLVLWQYHCWFVLNKRYRQTWLETYLNLWWKKGVIWVQRVKVNQRRHFSFSCPLSPVYGFDLIITSLFTLGLNYPPVRFNVNFHMDFWCEVSRLHPVILHCRRTVNTRAITAALTTASLRGLLYFIKYWTKTRHYIALAS